MSTRVKEILVVAVVFIVALILYVAKINGWGGLQLSTTVSLIIIALLALSLLWILILTLRGHLVDRRVVFLYVGIAVALPFLMTISQKMSLNNFSLTG